MVSEYLYGNSTQAINARGFTFNDHATCRVSYVMPTRDRGQYVVKAIDMMRCLMKPGDELIIVDGGSTDGAVDLISQYSDLVSVFISEPDSNSSHASNKGMLVARGKYIKWINDDDQFFSAGMEQAVHVLDNHPEIDVLLCGGTREFKGKITPVYVRPGTNYGKSPEDVFKYTASGMGIVIRRSILSQVGLINPLRVAADGEFIARAIANGANVKFCRINLYHHPIYKHSSIVARKKEYNRDVDRLVRQYCSLFFYLSFRLKNMILRHPILATPALAIRDFGVSVLAEFGSRWANAKQSPQKPMWDGGFS